MIRNIVRRSWDSIDVCVSHCRPVRNSSHHESLQRIVDQNRSNLLGLGFGGSSGPQKQARGFFGMASNSLRTSVNEAVGESRRSSRFGNEILGPHQLSQVRGFLQLRTKLNLADNSGAGPHPHQLSQVRGFIQLRTNLDVADNSGARRVQCIKVMKGSNAAKIGDTIMASVKDAQPRGKVKKGEVVTCVVVRAATQKLRRDGSEIKFDRNAVVLVNKQGEPIGTRIFGPVPHELRRRKMVKILTLADHVA